MYIFPINIINQSSSRVCLEAYNINIDTCKCLPPNFVSCEISLLIISLSTCNCLTLHKDKPIESTFSIRWCLYFREMRSLYQYFYKCSNNWSDIKCTNIVVSACMCGLRIERRYGPGKVSVRSTVQCTFPREEMPGNSLL